MKFDKCVAFAFVALSVSMATAFVAHADETSIATGPWGSTEISSGSANLVVTGAGATLDVGCGAITIAGALALDESGMKTFAATQASYLPRPNVPGTPLLVTIQVNGDIMNLIVISSVIGSDGTVVPHASYYVLQRGKTALFAHCA